MDRFEIRSNSIIDLETGGTGRFTQDDKVKELGLGLVSISRSSSEKTSEKLGRLKIGSLNSIRKIRSCDELSSSEDEGSSYENLEILVGEKGEKAKISLKKNGIVKESRKKKNSKPPLPPRGPSLDAADLKLVREMSDLARLKHTRTQRIKELKKKRAEKASSPSSNIFPMVVTIIFFFVMIFQGLLGSHV